METTERDTRPHRGGQRSGEHPHGPVPSLEWTLVGSADMIVSHLKTMATALALGDDHFHVVELPPDEHDLPPRFQIELGDEPVGALDFLALPDDRTLMRLYMCSDLGTVCSLEHGEEVATAFAQAWLGRLQQLGFLASVGRDNSSEDKGPIGFRGRTLGREDPR